MECVDLGLCRLIPEGRGEGEGERGDEGGDPIAGDRAIDQIEECHADRPQKRGHEVDAEGDVADRDSAERVHDQHPRRVAGRVADPEVVGGGDEFARIAPAEGGTHGAEVAEK